MGKGNPSYMHYRCIYIYVNMCANYIKLRSISNQAWLNIAVFYVHVHKSTCTHHVYISVYSHMYGFPVFTFKCMIYFQWYMFISYIDMYVKFSDTYSPPHVYTCKDVYMYMSFHVQPKDTHLHDTYLYMYVSHQTQIYLTGATYWVYRLTSMFTSSIAYLHMNEKFYNYISIYIYKIWDIISPNSFVYICVSDVYPQNNLYIYIIHFVFYFYIYIYGYIYIYI